MKKHGFTILVAEDEATDQEFIKMAFQGFAPGVAVQVVSDGRQAIAYVMGEGQYSDRAKYPYPTFIMTDLKMPGADGFAVLEHLKANPAWTIIPTVVLSASNDPDDVRTAYLLGASAYHVKPQSFPELRNQLKTLYDYWMTCQVPDVDPSGKQLPTASAGRLGARFPQPSPSSQTPVKH